MKLEIDEEVVAENVNPEHLDDLDFSQNISLIAGESRFLQWWVEDDGEVSINFRGGDDQEAKVAEFTDGFAPEEILNAFKSFLANDDSWASKFEWMTHSELGPNIGEGEWHASVVLVDEDTPASVLCNVGISEVIDELPLTQFVLFGLHLQSPDQHGLATEEESEFCDAIETEIALFAEDHEGVSVGEVTLAGTRRYYTYNNATESDLQSFLGRIAKEFDYELSCEIEEDPEKIRYWADLYPDSDDDLEDEDEDKEDNEVENEVENEDE